LTNFASQGTLLNFNIFNHDFHSCIASLQQQQKIMNWRRGSGTLSSGANWPHKEQRRGGCGSCGISARALAPLAPLFHVVQQLDCVVECRKTKTRRRMNGATLAKLTGARGAAALAEFPREP